MKRAFKIADLIVDYIHGEISREGLVVLDSWLEESEENRRLFVSFMDEAVFREERQKYDRENADAVFERIKIRKQQILKQRRLLRLRWMAGVAAAVLIVFGIFRFEEGQRPANDSKAGTTEIVVGKQKAILTLASGERYELAEYRNDTILTADDFRQIIFREGEVKIDREEGEDDASQEYNEMEVPRGAEYKLILPDGTRVWLNAETKLRFPSVFGRQQRYVELAGEAYFEVAHDAEHPFIVHADEVDVKVLGTEFCMSHYPGKPAFTTLVKGRVEVADRNGWKAVLKPGEQAVTQEGISEVREVETLYYTAWKDGYFIFENTALEDIMEKLSLWYNCNYFFENQYAAEIRMTARLKKYDEIDVLLNILSKTKEVEFEKKENTIVIRKK